MQHQRALLRIAPFQHLHETRLGSLWRIAAAAGPQISRERAHATRARIVDDAVIGLAAVILVRDKVTVCAAAQQDVAQGEDLRKSVAQRCDVRALQYVRMRRAWLRVR